ncbi:zona pellucida sperm-binding protein 4-like [Heterodontus francisci]|uniref:zona pellucida sperm-binding protein 4-like n=1 Tax=Heterodontus francisci TaxID=7792 RepID=UPI00355C3FD4
MGRWMVCRSLCFLAGLSLLSAQPLLPGDDVCVTEADWRFECGHPGISSSDCTSQGCCFDPRSSAVHPCFYSLRNSPVCTADGQFLLVISRNLTRPALNLSSLYVKDGQAAECRSWYVDSEYPIQRFLQDPVFVEVRVQDRIDPMIVLKLRDCWATPVPDPLHEVQWSLLVDGCPYVGDDYQTLLHTVDVFSGLKFPTHHKRFEVKTFVFLHEDSEQPLSGKVYLHCSAEVCSPSALDDCTAKCGPKRRRSTNDHEGTLVSAPGPIIFLEDESALSQKLHEVNDAAGSHWALRGAAIGFMMVSLSLLVVMAAMYRMKEPRAVASKCSEIELNGRASGLLHVSIVNPDNVCILELQLSLH